MTDEKKIKREATSDDIIRSLNEIDKKLDKLFDCMLMMSDAIDVLSGNYDESSSDDNTIDIG